MCDIEGDLGCGHVDLQKHLVVRRVIEKVVPKDLFGLILGHQISCFRLVRTCKKRHQIPF